MWGIFQSVFGQKLVSLLPSEMIPQLKLENALLTPKGEFTPAGFDQADEVKLNTVDFNREFVTRMIPRLEWEALVQTAESLGHGSDLPRELVSGYENDEDFLKKVHHVLLEVEVIEGALKCPESGTEFPINRGIPNMLINEEES
ncbi:multifunctional methyltransferase subunit TRM112-like protein isoform X1 [Bufo gargarizans]|uniref:multifunctional methyltransferase subunit TRM112-like protein isoform X1 n=1 Tax=Bufo gargarizans TaxID=30331 RepID=UPI001CF4ACD3|nr:multifunctional methyltransferase subunit TRM112-like protein isoform X1 [Bufo gargarizans]